MKTKTMLAGACVFCTTTAMATELPDGGLTEELSTGWCQTYDKAKFLLGPGDGGCPTEGDCDIPDVRDGYLTSEATEFLMVRVHVQVFCADNGSNCAGTEQDVHDRMREMNLAYAPWRIRFVYTWEFHNDSEHRLGGDDDAMKIEYAFEPDRRLNFYVSGNQSSAYGYFPWNSEATAPLGGVVCGAPFFNNAEYVFVHESGHNLGLWHTHHGVSEVQNCSPCYERADGQDADTTGDFASDTPPTPINTSCNDPSGNDTCSNTPWGDTLPEDYMSYGFFDPDPCWDRFTPQQGARMHCWITARLSTWLACLTDLDNDDQTTFQDLLLVLGAWGECEACNADINGDGVVNFQDIARVVSGWGACSAE